MCAFRFLPFCYFSLVIYTLLLPAGCAQNSEPYLVGAPCEGCEAVLEYSREPPSIDTLPGFGGPGKRIKLTGTVYQNDGRTPAPGVILYIYHTDQSGQYTPGDHARGWERQHGAIRTWLKTDERGSYTVYTVKPGQYPSGAELPHIHIIVLEPNGRYYWIDGVHFAEDAHNQAPSDIRGGGSARILFEPCGTLHCGQKNIILGKNIPNY